MIKEDRTNNILSLISLFPNFGQSMYTKPGRSPDFAVICSPSHFPPPTSEWNTSPVWQICDRLMQRGERRKEPRLLSRIYELEFSSSVVQHVRTWICVRNGQYRWREWFYFLFLVLWLLSQQHTVEIIQSFLVSFCIKQSNRLQKPMKENTLLALPNTKHRPLVKAARFSGRCV